MLKVYVVYFIALPYFVITGFSFEVPLSSVILAEPVNDVLSNQHGSACHLKGPNEAMDAIIHHYCEDISSKVYKANYVHKAPLQDLVKSMCEEDDKIKSLSENVVKSVCKSEAKTSEIVPDIIKKTCSVVYTL